MSNKNPSPVLSRIFLPAVLLTFAFGASASAQQTETGSHGEAHGLDNASRGGSGAPEISPGFAAAGVVLLIGGTLVLMGRRRAKTA